MEWPKCNFYVTENWKNNGNGKRGRKRTREKEKERVRDRKWLSLKNRKETFQTCRNKFQEQTTSKTISPPENWTNTKRKK